MRVLYSLKFDHFRGTKSISMLVTYPINFFEEVDSDTEVKTVEQLKADLVKRGTHFNTTVRYVICFVSPLTVGYIEIFHIVVLSLA